MDLRRTRGAWWAGRLEYDADHLDDASRDINAMIGTTNG
ncbi:hypothetical protein MAV_1799 [Mycobacterium avium 104]|uniref:Uncharacterized protein n=1 Tax=Mycobacterium avium (strain 104) TaxID=243243 RepID=A0A0H2ZWT1_MYCA1|nr:hypothetical protein MAV_1799 [Mycobacterium avium 104]